MHFHYSQQELFTKVLSQIAKENNKSLDRIQRLLLIKKNNAIIQRFWQILDDLFPEHPFTYIDRCAECATFELCEPTD